MPTAPAKSLWDTYAVMVEKSPTYTVILTGAVLVLVLLIFVFGVLASSAGLRTFLRKIIRGIKYSEGKLAYEGSSKSDDMEIQTDEKGNVKPPAEQKEPPTSQAASLIRIFGYLPCRMHGERWNTRSRKLKNAMVICKILQGIFPRRLWRPSIFYRASVAETIRHWIR